MTALPQKLDDFAGRWQLSRRIEDARAGQVMQAQGQARLLPGDGGLVYEEELTLLVPGQVPITATRRYLWRQVADGIDIAFDDGRFFHHMALGQSAPHDHHDCPPDKYDALYGFANWPEWDVRWAVSGPRKSYVMWTTYKRVP